MILKSFPNNQTDNCIPLNSIKSSQIEKFMYFYAKINSIYDKTIGRMKNNHRSLSRQSSHLLKKPQIYKIVDTRKRVSHKTNHENQKKNQTDKINCAKLVMFLIFKN